MNNVKTLCNNEEILPTLIKIEKHFRNDLPLKDFHENINRLNKHELQQIIKRNYIPERKSKSQLLHEVKYKKNWVNPGNLNDAFAPFDVLKPKVLSYWEQTRVNMPIRSYERYSIDKAFKLSSNSTKEFGFSNNEKDLNEQYAKYLKKHTKKYNHYIERPSHYIKKERFLPQLLDYKPPFKIQRSEFDTFNQLKHNTFIYENKYRMNN